MKIKQLKKLLSEFGNSVRFENDLKKKNWFNIGGKTKIFYKAENLKELFKNVEIINWGEIPDFDMIINATSLGLKEEDEIKLDISNVGNNKIFYDVIYNPIETNFLKKAKNLGHRVENGKMMFVYQAHQAFTLWHKVMPKIDSETIKLLDQ